MRITKHSVYNETSMSTVPHATESNNRTGNVQFAFA